MKSYYALGNPPKYFRDINTAIIYHATTVLKHNWIMSRDMSGRAHLLLQKLPLEFEFSLFLVTGDYEYSDMSGEVFLSKVTILEPVVVDYSQLNAIKFTDIKCARTSGTITVTDNKLIYNKSDNNTDTDYTEKYVLYVKIYPHKASMQIHTDTSVIKLQDIMGQFWPIYGPKPENAGILFMPDIGDDSGFWATKFRDTLGASSIICQYSHNQPYPPESVNTAIESQNTYRLYATDIRKCAIILASQFVVICTYGGYSLLLALYYSTLYPVSAIISVNPDYSQSSECEFISALKKSIQAPPRPHYNWDWIESVNIPILVMGQLHEPVKSRTGNMDITYKPLSHKYPHLHSPDEFGQDITNWISELEFNKKINI